MRNHTFNVIPALVGTMSTIGGTAVGYPIDTLGFADMLAILCAGGLQGSTGATVNIAVKWQESSTPTGTGALWTDITNEAVSQSSYTLPTITLGDELAGGTTTGTWLPAETVKKYAKLADGNRLRYIRCHATLTGTVGLGPKISVLALLGRTDDTYYVQTAVVQPSGNVEVSKLL